MKDLFDTIEQNTVAILGKRRKANKGSPLARHSLREALGSDDGFYGKDNLTWDDIEDTDFDRDFSRDEMEKFY
jgi:hypothetical protein